MGKMLLFLALLISCLTGFSQSRYISETTKKIVYARDGGVCQCCGSSSDLEYDHITPYSCGGDSEVSNIQLLCMQCNSSKFNSCVCKIHNSKIGTDCCDKKKSTNKPSNTSTQCTGLTQKKVRCKNRTTNPNGRCHHHQ